MRFDLTTTFYDKLESDELALLKKMLDENPNGRISAV